MPQNATDQLADRLVKVIEGEGEAQLILDIARQIELDWVELAIKIAIVAVALLLFRWFIKSLYFYILTRLNKYIRMGDLVRYNHSVTGRIKTYTFTTMVIETAEGYVNVPLSLWHSNYYTKLKTPDLDIRNLRKQKEDLELKMTSLEHTVTELEDHKQKLEDEVCKLREQKDNKEQ